MRAKNRYDQLRVAVVSVEELLDCRQQGLHIFKELAVSDFSTEMPPVQSHSAGGADPASESSLAAAGAPPRPQGRQSTQVEFVGVIEDIAGVHIVADTLNRLFSNDEKN
jgi:hypothetical protein